MAKAGLLFIGTDDGLVMFSDPGASGRWLRIGHELRGSQIAAVWPLFDDPQLVLAGGPNGLWRSGDGGASWQQIGNEMVTAFAGAKATPQTVEAQIDGAGTIRTDDGGSTWRLSDGSTGSPTMLLQIELAGKTPVQLRVQANMIQRREGDGEWANTSAEEQWAGELSVLSAARYHIDTAFAGTTGGQVATSSDRGRTWQITKRDLPAIRSITATRLA